MAADYPDIDIAPFIDHALLTPTATPEQVEQWCEEADPQLPQSRLSNGVKKQIDFILQRFVFIPPM